MKDCFNRDIEEGQLVAVAGSSTSSPFLSVGRVLGPCKKGSGIRVRIFHSSSHAFQQGLRRRKPGGGWTCTGTVVREKNASYVATFQCSGRILILHHECVPHDALLREPLT